MYGVTAGADLAPFLYSIAIGLLLGFERERSRPHGEARTAGVRTFAVLALLGTVAARLGPWVVAVGLGSVAAILAVGYRRSAQDQDDVGTTTEFAAVATFLLGALAFTRAPLAASLAIVTAALLVGKVSIHRFVREAVSDEEIEDAIKFLVIAFVVLPLLPDRSMGPYGILNPRHIWLIVVALSGISWLGYLAVRILGARRGLLVTGLAGGFVSASATTASMARRSRTTEPLRGSVAAAQVATVATFVELAIILIVVNRRVASCVWPSLLLGTVLLGLVVWLGNRRAGTDDETEPAGGRARRPLELRPALVLAVVLTLALLVGRWATAVFGAKGAVVAAGTAGLADAHAASLAPTTLFARGNLALSVTLVAIGVALAVNTVTKCVLAFGVGGRRFGSRFALGVIPVIVVVVGGLVVTAALV